jgi:hypothetical protein
MVSQSLAVADVVAIKAPPFNLIPSRLSTLESLITGCFILFSASSLKCFLTLAGDK